MSKLPLVNLPQGRGRGGSPAMSAGKITDQNGWGWE